MAGVRISPEQILFSFFYKQIYFQNKQMIKKRLFFKATYKVVKGTFCGVPSGILLYRVCRETICDFKWRNVASFGCSLVSPYILPASIVAYGAPLLLGPQNIQKLTGTGRLIYQVWSSPISLTVSTLY